MRLIPPGGLRQSFHVPVVALIAVLAMLASACGTSRSGAPDLTLEEIQAKINDAGIACDGSIGAPEDDGSAAMGVVIEQEFECTVDGTTINAGTFADEKALTKAVTVIEGFACAFGSSAFSYVSDGVWLVSASNEETTDSDTEMVDKIGDALGVKVKSIDCSDAEGVPDFSDTSSDFTSGSDTIGGATSDPVSFGDTFDWTDGVSVTILEPKDFSPDEFYEVEGAAGYVVFEVELTNGTEENFDPSSFDANLQSGTSEAQEVYDSEQLGQTPTTTLLPGRSAKFKIAFAVDDPNDLVLQVSPKFGFDYEEAIFTNA